MVTDDTAFPREKTALSFDFAFYRPWGAFHNPETCRSVIDCDQYTFYRTGKRFALATDEFPGENWYSLCFVFSTRVRPPLTSLSHTLSISLLERMISGEMTLVIKKFGEKEVWQVSTAARVWYYDGAGAQQTCEDTLLAARKSII